MHHGGLQKRWKYHVSTRMKKAHLIGRLIRHIPDKHFPMIRYAGLCSNRWKDQYRGKDRDALNQSDPDGSDENTQPLWAERQTDYTGIDPLLCPHGDKPFTCFGTFFRNCNELQALVNIVGKDYTIPPALLRPG